MVGQALHCALLEGPPPVTSWRDAASAHRLQLLRMGTIIHVVHTKPCEGASLRRVLRLVHHRLVLRCMHSACKAEA